MYGPRILSEYATDTPGVRSWRKSLGYDVAPHIERREWARLRALLKFSREDLVPSRTNGAVAKAVTDGSASDVL